MSDDLELEEFWKDLRPNRIVLVKDSTDPKGPLLLASELAAHELATRFAKWVGQELTAEILAQIVSEGVKTFIEKWSESLKEQNLSGLIEIVLEGQKLTPEELKGFVRALPDSLVERIVGSAVASGTGITALMALEHHHREGTLRTDYAIEQQHGRVVVRFTPTGRSGEITFGLYDEFSLEAPKNSEDPLV